MNLKGFFKECHEKEVFKMLSIYVVTSWVLLQVLALIADPLNFPKKSVTYLILILVIGFPIHVYFIWKFRLKNLEKSQTGDDSIKIYKSPFHRMYFSALIVISAISAFSAVIIINTNLISGFDLQEVNSQDKIAVLDFENLTGDNNLKIVGEIAANWIVHGITENEVAQVITPKVVNDYKSIIKSQASSVDINNLLKTYFKPGKVITGNFYKRNGKLLLQGTIMDGLMDKTLISFQTIECDPDSPLNCIEELKQEILGYLTTVDKQDNSGYINKDDNQKTSYFEETPPNFEAYQFLLKALANVDNDKIHLEYLNKSIKADPHFFEPKIHKIAYYFNRSNFKIEDSLIENIKINSKLTHRQRNILFMYESLLKGKYDKAYKEQKKEYDIAYLDLNTNYSTMTIALQLVNRPSDIDDIYKEIDMSKLNLDNCLQCGFRYYLKGLADVELKKYEQVIDELLPITKTIEDGYLKRPLIMAYIRSGNYKAVDDLFKFWEVSMSKKDMINLEMITGNEFLLADELDNAKAYFNKVISIADPNNDPIDIALSYYYSQDYKTAQDLLDKLHAVDPKNIDVIVKLAITNYKNGDHDKADQLIKSLDDLRADYQFGEIDYGFAQYYAVLNDKVNTFNYLLKAVAAGKWFTPTTFQNDPHFLTYKDTQEFKDILDYWNRFLNN